MKVVGGFMAKMKEVIEEKGELWAIAAMIDGSIGYHTINSARFFWGYQK